MKRLLLPALAALAACTETPRPYAPVHDVAYQAMGSQLFWFLVIGDDRIVLRTAQAAETIWPRTLPRIADGVRTWQSGEGADAITIEASPGPCSASNGRAYEDNVIVRSGGGELTGCGGRQIGPDRD
ncbi:MAG TPA: hypothetical protein VIT38_17475 [Allosphingosinicella sp.]|jgi:uncharacterized membrane protein